MSLKGLLNKASIPALYFTIFLIVLRDIFGVACPFIVFTAIAVASAVFSNVSSIYIYVIGLLPFCRGLPYSEMMLCVTVIALIKQFMTNDHTLRIKYYFPIIVLLIIELMDYAAFNSFSNEIVYLCLYMFFVAYGVDKEVFKNREVSACLTYSVATIVSVLIVVLREINLYGMQYIMTYSIRFGANTDGLMVTNYNSNELGLYCSVAVAILLSLDLMKSDRKYIFLALVTSAIGLVSISRSFMLITAVIWIVYLLKTGFSFKRILFLFASLILFVFVISKFFPSFGEWIMKYYQKRNEASSSDGLGGRLPIFMTMLDASFRNIYTILFGYSELYPHILGTSGAHNGTQEIVVSWGAVGLLNVSIWIYYLIIAWNKIKSPNISKYIGVFTFLLFVQTIQFFSMHNYLVAMLISLIPISYYSTHKTEKIRLTNQMEHDYE